MYNDSYDYLLNIPVYHLSKEKYEEYRTLAKKMKFDLKEYREKDVKDIWNDELIELEKALEKSGY